MNKKNFIFSFSIFLVIFILLQIPLTRAYIPVTYSCCYNFSNSSGDPFDGFEHINEISGNQLDDFENLSNWQYGSDGRTGGSQYNDTVNYKDGNQSLGLITPNNYRAYSDKAINNNFLNGNNFSAWIYVYNSSTFDFPRIYITSTGNKWSKYFYGSYYGGMYTGWNKLILTNKDFLQGTSTNETWNNKMNMLRIAMYPKSGLSTNVAVDDLRYNVSNEWIGGGSGASQQPDLINVKEGTEGLKLNAVNGGRAYSDKMIDNDFSKTNNFVLWVYIENSSSFDFIRIYLTSSGSIWTKYFQSSIYRPVELSSGFKTGWNRLVFDRNSFTSFYNESWNNRMNRIRIAIYARPGQNTSATLDDLRTDMSGKRAKIMFTFDDGDKNVSAKAAPILKANNQSGVSFVITSYVNTTDLYMNMSDLKYIQSNGWDVSSHTVNHPYLSDIDDLTLIEELNNSYDWLVNNGFRKSAGFIAYPYGAFDDNVINHVKKRYIIGRSTPVQPIQQHLDPTDDAELYIQKVIYVLNTTSVQEVKNKIDDIISSKLLGVMLFHDIAHSPNPENDPYTYSPEDLQNISDYLKSKSEDIDVVTYSDYVIPNIYNFTPVINKTTRIYVNGSSNLITKNEYDEYMPNMTVNPSSDSVDITITSFNESGGLIKFNESSQNNNLQVSYTIGNRIPNMVYNVKIYWSNGSIYQDFNTMSNSTGYISYNSIGFEDSRYQEITPGQITDTTFTVSMPIGYTFLRFNASNSTVTNLNADGQNSSQPIFNIMNNGNINQSFMFKLNDIVDNITTYADLTDNFSAGKIQINASNTTIITNLAAGSRQNIWMVIDSNRAPEMNTNRTLMINSNP